MVHLFEWKWTDIAQECEGFLGPRGFSAVQVSPPNEHAVIDGRPWYQRYQPVSYRLESRGGTRQEFIDMVETCRNAGVDIYVDAVINHMAGVLPEGKTSKGSAGSEFSRYRYPDYSYQDFHHCGLNDGDDIGNYQDRDQVQNCELVNLADLDTASDYVQRRIAEYLNDLVEIGVSGFRIDAAKHMAADDVRGILRRVRNAPFIYQEVINQKSEPIQANEYLENGDVTEFQYGLDVARVFREGKIAWFNGAHRLGEDWGYLPSDKAIVFIDNHDNQRGHGGGGRVLTHQEKELYELANIFMLAWPYGYPQVMSSFRFSTADQGPPTGAAQCLGAENFSQAKEGWVCEHRWPRIAAMVDFRNVTDGHFDISDWWSDDNNVIAFGRGPRGYVVINNSPRLITRTFQSSLPGGRYCDILGSSSLGSCVGSIVNVGKDGRFNATVKGHQALAIHIGSKLK